MDKHGLKGLVFPRWAIGKFLETLPQLVEVASGLRKADLVVRNVNLVDVAGGRVVENVSIVAYSGFIAALVSASDDEVYIGPSTMVINGGGSYAAPGFINAHVHVETSFLRPSEFSKLAPMHGTTMIVTDPHNIANAGGLKHLLAFTEEAIRQPLKVLVQVPSCVPPTRSEVDNPGYTLSIKDVEELLDSGLFHSLGEFMDYASVVNRDPEALGKIKAALLRGMLIYGHLPSPDDRVLNAYSSLGASSCHESTSLDEALGKLTHGMWVMLRFGSAWRDGEVILPGLIKGGYDLDRVILVTDDVSVMDLVEHGYMDRVVKDAVELGLDPVDAVKLVTINPATYLRLDNLVGVLAPGRLADIVLLRDLRSLEVDTVVVNGNVAYHNGQLMLRDFQETGTLTSLGLTFNIPVIRGLDDLAVRVGEDYSEALVLAIGVEYGVTVTRKVKVKVPVVNGIAAPNPDSDVAYVAVIDKYRAGGVGKGFVTGLGLRRGALAQSMGRDTHNILVIGADLGDMYTALRELERIRGGVVAVSNGEVKCRLRLSIGGLMSSEPFTKVYHEAKCLEDFLRYCGVLNPRMAPFHISILTLTVIPEVRVTPKGLVDVKSLTIINPILEVR